MSIFKQHSYMNEAYQTFINEHAYGNVNDYIAKLADLWSEYYGEEVEETFDDLLEDSDIRELVNQAYDSDTDPSEFVDNLFDEYYETEDDNYDDFDDEDDFETKELNFDDDSVINDTEYYDEDNEDEYDKSDIPDYSTELEDEDDISEEELAQLDDDDYEDWDDLDDDALEGIEPEPEDNDPNAIDTDMEYSDFLAGNTDDSDIYEESVLTPDEYEYLYEDSLDDTEYSYLFERYEWADMEPADRDAMRKLYNNFADAKSRKKFDTSSRNHIENLDKYFNAFVAILPKVVRQNGKEWIINALKFINTKREAAGIDELPIPDITNTNTQDEPAATEHEPETHNTRNVERTFNGHLFSAVIRISRNDTETKNEAHRVINNIKILIENHGIVALESSNDNLYKFKIYVDETYREMVKSILEHDWENTFGMADYTYEGPTEFTITVEEQDDEHEEEIPNDEAVEQQEIADAPEVIEPENTEEDTHNEENTVESENEEENQTTQDDTTDTTQNTVERSVNNQPRRDVVRRLRTKKRWRVFYKVTDEDGNETDDIDSVVVTAISADAAKSMVEDSTNAIVFDCAKIIKVEEA